MIVFLKKVRVKSIFTIFEPVVVEPLELCYLSSALNEMNIKNYVIDELFSLKEPPTIKPTIIVLTGYNVAENEIIKDALNYKIKYPKVKIIIGGVHIQGNTKFFHMEGIDYIFHSQSLNTFKTLIQKIKNSDETPTIGVDSYVKDKDGISKWLVTNKEILQENEPILPNRSILNNFSNKLRYLDKKNVALIKGSIGCPYNCSYCYCKLLNNGHYVSSNYEKIISEMESINAEYFWVVDDVLFSTRKDALEFIKIVKSKNLKLKIIGYLRADFILSQEDLLTALKEAGLTEVIVGFEATNNEELKNYKKATDALDYPRVISLLKENNIDLTALFMVQPSYEIKDFINLYRFIKGNNIEIYTISILTPIKGTNDYELLKDKLTTDNPQHFDFLHLVLKSKLPRWFFYLLFYGVQLRLLKSKRILRYLLSLFM